VKFKTTIPAAPPEANPRAGARKVAGKTNGPEAVMTDAPSCKAAPVKEAKYVDGAAKKAIWSQVTGDGGSNSPNGDPKRRGRSFWGVEEPKT
jgi:hypothetical protein